MLQFSLRNAHLKHFCAGLTVFALSCTFMTDEASAHPHVFADARLELTLDKNGAVERLAHVWRFDDLFSSTVLMEFDKNGDLILDQGELNELSKTIGDSLKEFNYFQTVLDDGKDVKMSEPSHLRADFVDNQLLILFETKPAQPLNIKSGHIVSFGVYDPTFYTAIDFLTDEDLHVDGLPSGCKSQVIRPDPDEALAQNQGTLTDAFFNDPMGTDMSKIFATRLELSCGAKK
ncbi:DUF1007 family protein [Paenochrobactrum sp. BZR 588]|uniref:DUF1007 family protein n=1 Tax=Paenochrobactrum TaxID=999488 RepID=UPI0035BBAA8C